MTDKQLPEAHWQASQSEPMSAEEQAEWEGMERIRQAKPATVPEDRL